MVIFGSGDYSHRMKAKEFFFKLGRVSLTSGVVVLGTLTGCVGYVDRGQPQNVYYTPAPSASVVVVEDDYVYYPDYQIYYSSHRHQYAYRDGGAWVARPAPVGVSVDVLFASPSVQMNFHDAPARHHDAVVRQYPKGWSAGHSNKEQKEDRKNGKRDEHNDNKR